MEDIYKHNTEKNKTIFQNIGKYSLPYWKIAEKCGNLDYLIIMLKKRRWSANAI